MKKLLTVLLLLFLICCKESGVQLAKPSTFVRYFSGGFPDQAQAIIETADKGFIILANTQPVTAPNNHYKIKIIKTDSYGNQVWQVIFPDYGSKLSGGDYRGFGLSAIHDNSGTETGYVIVGDSIKDNNHALMMLQVDPTGKNITSKVFKNLNVQGVGIAQSHSTTLNGDYFVIGQSYSGNEDMFFAQVSSTTLNTVWTNTFGSASTQLANRVFFDDTEQNAYWGGTRIDADPVNPANSGSLIRFNKAGFNSKSVGFDLTYPIGSTWNLRGSDLCQFGSGFAFVGSGFAGSSQYDSIVFSRVDASGAIIYHNTYQLKDAQNQPQPQNIAPGDSICATQDGGLLILGTLALDTQGTNTDYLLIKTDGACNVTWTRTHGSKFIDIGSKVMQASDGGYIVLGTTNLANVQSIFLMKTDSEGNIQ